MARHARVAHRTKPTIRHARGTARAVTPAADSPASFTATVAKKEFGRLLDIVLGGGRVVITKHDAPKAVVLSMADFNALTQATERTLEALGGHFETTLGGATITALLERALASGLDVRVWYVGLGSVELHLARVRARVAAGGHDIPEATVRRRFHDSRLNLIRLLPRLTELRVYDNSAEADPRAGVAPEPRLLLQLARGP